MPLLIGQPIDARELEQATSQWSPERLASMCDALVWAVSERKYSNLPRFTGRIYAADDGIDAEWDLEIPLDEKVLPTPIIGTGWNVFQYKKRDLIAQDRRRIVANLKASLKRAIAALAKKKAKHPSRYILFVNVDLTGDQVEALKESLLEGYDRSSEVHVEIIGAGGLAALLNDNPHLRAAYFSSLSFRTWREADRLHRTQKLFRADVALVGRAEELNRLRSFIDNRLVKVLVVTGPHDIGKSRLVLEATGHREHDIVFVLDTGSMGLNEYRGLVAAHGRVICVIEDPDTDRTEPLINEILGIEGLKVVITLPASGHVAVPSYRQDERVQSIPLGPLSGEDSRKLLNSTGKHFDFGVESWILDQAGGNPGILLAAASVGEKLRVEAGDFAEAVGGEFERRIKSELGRDALKCAELLSVLTYVGVSGRFEAELRVICDLFGEGWQLPKVLAALEVLEQAGLAKRGGSFAEITPPILAHYLAGKLLHGRTDEVFALFGRLDERARLRFLRRLSQVRAEEVERFWDALFDPRQPDTPFGSLKSALKHAYMLRLIAGTVPERTLQLLESGLTGMSLQERLAINNEQRREVMWALEQLLFRSKTSAGALRSLTMLAEAETETYANNATGVLCESFHPLHPQLPLSLDERVDVLKEILSPKYSLDLRLIGVKAIESALSRMGAITLRRSTGPEPLDSPPSMTYPEVRDYIEALVDLLMKAAQSDESTLAISASAALPHVIAECAIQARPEAAVAYFKVATDWVLTGKVPIRTADLTDSLRFARRVLGERAQKAGKEAGARHKKSVEELDALLASFDRGDFTSRLKRWAGKWTHDDRDYELEEGGRRLYRGEKELRALAREAVDDPATLADDLLTWLCTREAQKAHMFFWWLGALDSDQKWLLKIERLGASENGVIAFSAYFGGLSKQDSLLVSKRLDELVLASQVTGDAIVGATRYLAADLAGIRRMENLLQEKRVHPAYVERTLLCGAWIDRLTSEEYVRILRAIAGPELENGAAVIDSLGMWMHGEKTIDGELAEFAWQILESAPSIDGSDAYDCDRLASKLAEADPERGFRLLERLLSQPYERRAWNPIDRYGAGEREFWRALHNVDRERALRTVLSLALTDPLKHFQITWDFQDIVDQQGDAGLLVKLALDNDEQAEVIAQSITTARPGFWPIAFEIVKNYRTNRKIREALTGGIEQKGEVYSGPYSQHLESCRKEVERVLNDPAAPPAARTWLQDVLSRFKAEIAQHIIWEYDEDVNSLRRYIEDRDSPERIWAIGRVLKYADLRDIRRLLTVEDISEALPQVDLPEKKRRALERALEVWQSGS